MSKSERPIGGLSIARFTIDPRPIQVPRLSSGEKIHVCSLGEGIVYYPNITEKIKEKNGSFPAGDRLLCAAVLYETGKFLITTPEDVVKVPSLPSEFDEGRVDISNNETIVYTLGKHQMMRSTHC